MEGPKEEKPQRDELTPIEEAKERYFRSKKGKEALARYATSEGGKRSQERYARSAKGRLARRKYYYSEKGQEAHERRRRKIIWFKVMKQWLDDHPGKSLDDFYKELKEEEDGEDSTLEGGAEKDGSQEG